MLIDLHSHTTGSDGKLPLSELIALAHEKGVKALAITDHDRVFLPEEAEALSSPVTLISGTELSCTWAKQTIHVVGVNFPQTQAAPLLEHCQEISLGRARRAMMIAEKLEKLGMKGAYEGALAQADGGQIGRPHFARWMLEQGHIKDMSTAFKRFLGAGKVGDIKTEWPTLAVAVHAIVAAGGTPVLAHPKQYKMTNTKLRALIQDFVHAGGKAIEVSNGFQPSDQVRYLVELANAAGLLCSAGSDFHGPQSPYHFPGGYSALPADAVPVWHDWQV